MSYALVHYKNPQPLETGNKISLTHRLRGKAFQPEKAGNCRLFVFPDGNRFVFFAEDTGDSGKLEFFRSYEVEMETDQEEKKLEKMQELNPELSLDYKSSYLIVSGKFALCPAEFFNPTRKNMLFKYNHKLEGNEELHHQFFRGINAYAIFAVKQKSFHLYSRKFQGIQTLPAEVCLAENLLNNPPQEKGTFLHTHTGKDSLTIAVIRDNKLLLLNSFSWQEYQDILYYVLFVAKQTGVRPDKNNFYFSGEIDKNSPAYRLLYQYIENPVLSIDKNLLLQSSNGDGEIAHRYFKTLSALSCE